MSHIELPVSVRSRPHWRVVLRPGSYQQERVPTLPKCWETMEQTRVRLRGWDYPHVSNRDSERRNGVNWVASWSDFMGHVEYWRFYQSGQFVHLFSIREAADRQWHDRLRDITKVHLSHLRAIEWDGVPGFIDIDNFIYSTTEIFEFAARVVQRVDYSGEIEIAIALNGVNGFMLTTEPQYAWHNSYAARIDAMGHSWQIAVGTLVADSANLALEAVLWFFERFGWDQPPVEILRSDQQKFLSGRR